MKEMVAFFLSKGIVKGGELIIYLFFAVTYFCWSVDVFVVIVVVAVCLFVFYAFFVLCCRPVSSKHFVINLQLIWAEIIPVSWSNPEIIVTIGTAVRVTSKVRIGISSRIVRNIHIMALTKGWTIIIIAVSGVAIVAVGYVLFEVSIPFVVFQWVQEGICRILITSRPWRDKKTEHKQLEIQRNSVEFNRPFYSYGWKRGWSGPCFDTTISAFLICKSFFFFFFILTSTF